MNVFTNTHMICSRFTETPKSRITTKPRIQKAMTGHQHLGHVYNVPHVPVTGEVMEFQTEQSPVHQYCSRGSTPTRMTKEVTLGLSVGAMTHGC